MSAQFWYLGFWQGLALGMLLFLCSAGFTLVYSLMGILNFAHAAFFMLGAYIAFSVHTQFGFMVALLVAPVFVAALGAALEWGLLRRVHGQGHMAEMLLTFGLFLVVVEAVQLVWGRAPLSLDATALDAWIPRVEGIPLSPLRLALIGVGLLVWLGLCVLHSSRWGDRIRAAVNDAQALSVLGYAVDKLVMAVFALGAGLAALAGVFAGALWSVEPALAWTLGPLLFVIVALGGVGSLRGALVVALALGFMQSYAALAGGMWSTLAGMLPFIALLLLGLRPQGLDGQRAA